MPTNRRVVQASGADFYPTPAWATYALIDNETFEGSIWEPACGTGSMSEVLKATGNRVFSTDVHNYGYVDCHPPTVDFLTTRMLCDNIVTNPPYNLAEQFVRVGYTQCDNKLCLLLRLSFLEGAGRASGLFAELPPSRVWVFSERITFYPNGVRTGGSGTTAYAWFVWDKGYTGDTILKWIPPGYKARYGE